GVGHSLARDLARLEPDPAAELGRLRTASVTHHESPARIDQLGDLGQHRRELLGSSHDLTAELQYCCGLWLRHSYRVPHAQATAQQNSRARSSTPSVTARGTRHRAPT